MKIIDSCNKEFKRGVSVFLASFVFLFYFSFHLIFSVFFFLGGGGWWGTGAQNVQ